MGKNTRKWELRYGKILFVVGFMLTYFLGQLPVSSFGTLVEGMFLSVGSAALLLEGTRKIFEVKD